MSLSTRKDVLLIKQESVYGQDPTPTGAANAILVSNLQYARGFSLADKQLMGGDNLRRLLGGAR